MTKAVRAGAVVIGGGAPISVQSMTNTDTRDIQATLAQIAALAQAGCDLVRISVYDKPCALAVRALVDKSPVPLVADIHFDHELAVAAMENGIAKLRINPGNIGGADNVRRVADCAKAHGVPIRIGVNAGSLPKPILNKWGKVCAQALVAAAAEHVVLLEEAGFDDLVLSMKASDVRLTVETYRLAHQRFDYPLHVGVTEAGLPQSGAVKSAIGIGTLLLDGIGDTIRVSLTGSPLPEAAAALAILRALDLRAAVDIISCPTCGRTQGDVQRIAQAIEARTQGVTKRLKVAVMGCIVNGPGEAAQADIAYCCGSAGRGALYVRGKLIRTILGDPVEALMEEIRLFSGDAP